MRVDCDDKRESYTTDWRRMRRGTQSKDENEGHKGGRDGEGKGKKRKRRRKESKIILK